MKTNMGLKFWMKELRKKFELNEVGNDLLNILEISNPHKLLSYILYKFGRLYRSEIIDDYAEKFTVEKINLILQDLDEDELNKNEIEDYDIKFEG